ncbi:FluC/FEX family fluoride channel [Nonomuraea sp. KM90]|uniref:FluC/FEX family fluoride channel n=1 Tax=Nonomuraea sp. KM90 TaxID=3457428 RepID=UPI003FCE8D50
MGSLTRYGISSALPHDPTGFPWSMFGINVSGCLLIGVLMTLNCRLSCWGSCSGRSAAGTACRLPQLS